MDWGIFWKMLISEGEDQKVAEMFYREMSHAVILFISETWVMTALMERMLDGTHTGFMRQISGTWTRWKVYMMWSITVAEELKEAAVTQSDITYIRRR